MERLRVENGARLKRRRATTGTCLAIVPALSSIRYFHCKDISEKKKDMFKTIDPDVQKRPNAFFAWLRQNEPVFHDPYTGAFFISKEEHIRQVTMDVENFSNVIDPSVFRIVQGYGLEQSDPEVAAILKAKGWILPTTLLIVDPPEHNRYREFAKESLTPRSVRALSDAIRSRADQLIAQFPTNEPVDFVESFAKAMPLWLIGKYIFGAPEEDFGMINDWADQFFLTLIPTAPREEYLRTVDQMIEMHHYIKRNIDRFRKEPDHSVLLSRLIHMRDANGGSPLTDEEMMSMMQVLLIAGHDTTRQSLTNCVLELARHPHLVERLRANPRDIPNFIAEVLRLNSPANVTARLATGTVVVGGVEIPAGSMIFVAWGSGNRDVDAHPEPDEFDIDRPEKNRTLAFGYGIHHCVGIHLAREQLRVSIEQLLAHYSGVALAIGEQELDYLPSFNTRSIVSLPVRFTPAL